MTQFIKKKIFREIIGIIDVGSYKIRVCICEFKNDNIKLLAFSEKRQSNEDIINNEIKNLEGICENIELAIKKAEKTAGLKIEQIVINHLFSESFFYSKKISFSRKDSLKKIDEQELYEIISKTENMSILSASKKIEENSLYKLENLDIILSNISEIKVDNSNVESPISHIGKNISFNILNIFIPKSSYEAIKYIGNYTNKKIIKILPEEFCLSKIWEKNQDIVIINIGNSSSYITIKDKSWNIIGSIKIGVGIENLINTIREKTAFSRAEIIKKIDRNDFMTNEKKEFLDIYSFLVIEGIKEIIGTNICPNNFFIVGGGGNNKFFKTYFEKVDFNSLGLKLTPKIKFIIPDINKIGKIENIETILSKSNLNIVSMIISCGKIINHKQDFIEKSLEKAVNELVNSEH